ncbi:translation initiation factor IF-2 N-terminal domain-containing protein [uncultured Lactococcus sp.]|uniref:translation initiation factor IF-2 N-terminal domain-containing protein n=1 Tax=uncultured Lactococcus sp. TaxID=167973 RepID=UPI0027DBF980|nr:translation initiation factor IF-2 N-terminal domain-containing protein [uncultured Lactococcus sp.]
MKIYELARDLGVDQEALLFLAQKEGLEVKSVASKLTEEEKEQLLQAFDAAEGVIDSIEKDVLKHSKEKQEAANHNFIEKNYEAPRKKKKFFQINKGIKNKGIKLQKQQYERPALPRNYSQKKARLFLAGLVSATVLIGVGSGIAYTQAKHTVQEEGKTIIQEGKASVNAISNLSRSTNYEAQIFCEDFARAYLNFSSEAKTQEKQLKTLQVYYGQSLPLASQGMKRNPSRLNEIKLLSITKDTAKFLVNITTQEIKTTSIKGKVKREVKENTVQKILTVSYGDVKGKYYISSFPTLEDVPKVFAGEKAPKVDFTASSELSSSEIEKLDTFVKNVLVAKGTNQKDLNLLAQGLTVSTGESFKSIDYSYYKKNSDKSYKAVIQASFSNALGIVPENLTFTIEKTGETYFAKDFSQVIDSKDLQK